MIWAIGFYWFCAGLASFKLDRLHNASGGVEFVASLVLGGVFIPVRILAKLAQ